MGKKENGQEANEATELSGKEPKSEETNVEETIKKEEESDGKLATEAEEANGKVVEEKLDTVDLDDIKPEPKRKESKYSTLKKYGTLKFNMKPKTEQGTTRWKCSIQ